VGKIVGVNVGRTFGVLVGMIVGVSVINAIFNTKIVAVCVAYGEEEGAGLEFPVQEVSRRIKKNEIINLNSWNFVFTLTS